MDGEPILDIEELEWDLAIGGPCRPVTAKRAAAPRRALVSYLPGALQPTQAHPGLDFAWSNTGQIRCLVRCLIDLGFLVDVVHLGVEAPPPRTDYEVFLGHPGPAFGPIHRALPAAVRRIYLATEAYRSVHEQNAAERSRRCMVRRGLRLQPDRQSTGNDADLRVSHALLGNGNAWTQSTYPAEPRSEFIENAAYTDRAFFDSPGQVPRGEPAGVLYYSGAGPLHKGLDVVLEAVAATAIELHVCSLLSPQFKRAYQYELRSVPNVHFHGWVAPNSAALRAIVARCSFSILASCSEGSPGSVAQTLQYGLIPLVTPESGFAPGELGVVIPEAEPAALRALLEQTCSWDSDRIARQRRAVVALAARRYTPAAYRERLTAALLETFRHLGVVSCYG